MFRRKGGVQALRDARYAAVTAAAYKSRQHAREMRMSVSFARRAAISSNIIGES